VGTSVWKSVAKVRKLIFSFYGLLKMSHGQSLPDPDPELINSKSLDFAKTLKTLKTSDVMPPH